MARAPSLSPSAAALRASVFAELAPLVEAHVRGGGALVPLHIGDTCLSPPSGARLGEVAAGCDDALLHRYGPIAGDTLLMDAVLASLARRARPFASVTARHVLIGGGATHALFCAARAMFEPGDEVLVVSPYWPLAVGVLRAAGAVPVEVPMPAARAAGIEGALEAAIGPRTRGVYFISPNNPDGTVWSHAELAALAAVAERNHLWIVADEVYADFVFDGPFVSIAALPGMAARTVTAYSFSKSHALAGARVGLVVGPPAVIELARRVSTHTLFNVPVVSQRACAAALATGDPWVDAAREVYRNARDVALEALAPLGGALRVVPPAGGTYLFVDFAPVLGGRPLRGLLERAIARGVFLAPGEAFGAGFESWARLCYSAVPVPVLREGLAALASAVEDVAGCG